MLKIDLPEHSAVRYVAERMREADAAEFLAVSHAVDRAQLADLMVERYTDEPSAYCAFHDDAPVAIGAMIEGRPNVATLMFFATDEFPSVVIDLTRFIVRRLFPRYRNLGVHRIECISIDGYEAAHRWIGLLGLRHEAVMPGYGKSGETYHQFAWVRE